MINAWRLAEGEQKKELDMCLIASGFDNAEIVDAVTKIYDDLSIREMTKSRINAYFEKGFDALKNLSVSEVQKKPLLDFTNYLINREK